MAKWSRLRITPISEMAFVLLISSSVTLLLGLGLRRWAVTILFVVFIPAAAIKAFLDYRRKRDVIAGDSILNLSPK